MRLKIIPCLLWASVACIGLAQSPGAFTATGNTTMGRWFHTATLLANGQVLIAGGGGSAGSAELYNPANGTFTATGEMSTRRISGHTATLLADGRVLIAGGAIASSSTGVTNTRSAELYDPSTGTFAATSNMIEARACPAAVLLGNGKALIVGGANWNEPSKVPGAELYDPASGTFGVAGEYATTNLRRNPDFGLCPKAILLPDGGV